MHAPLPPFPHSRPRRLRRDAFTRELVREHRVHPSDLIWPVFVLDGQRRSEDVPEGYELCPWCGNYEGIVETCESCDGHGLILRVSLPDELG